VIDLATVDGMMKAKEQIATVMGRRKVPNVFVGIDSIGGGDETVSLQKAG
jgi:glutaredoxin